VLLAALFLFQRVPNLHERKKSTGRNMRKSFTFGDQYDLYLDYRLTIFVVHA